MQKSNYRVTINWRTEKHGYFKFFRMHLKNVMIFARSNDARIFCEWLREENATFHALFVRTIHVPWFVADFFLVIEIFSFLKKKKKINKRYFYQYIYFQFHLDICLYAFYWEIETFLFSLFYSVYTFQKTV